jgi:glycosyltransferase involved in cell wall biosynthesis
VAQVRILAITSSYPKFEGDSTAPFIESITKALVRRGHQLTVVLPARSDLSPVPIPGVRFRPYRYAPAERFEVFGYAEALRADVKVRWATYAVSPLAILCGARALRAELRRGDYDVVHAHWVVPNGATARLALGSTPLPLVVSLHGSDVFLSERKAIVRRAARSAFSRAAAATACSEDLARRSLAVGAKVMPTVIPYGVDTTTFRPDGEKGQSLRRDLGLGKERFVVLAVGRLVRKKGFEYLVDAAVELEQRGAPVTIVIAGRGDLDSELENRARAKGVVAAVKLVGNVERETLPSYFAMADAVVVPSVRDEAGNVDGLPNVLLEAMASGSAIVASDVAGIPHAARAGREALLVPEKNPTAIADAIETLSKSTALAGTLGSAARRRAAEAYSWDLVGERFESVLRTVTQARSA